MRNFLSYINVFMEVFKEKTLLSLQTSKTATLIVGVKSFMKIDVDVHN